MHVEEVEERRRISLESVSLRDAVKLELHDAGTDTDADILATILARMSARMSVSVSWNASFRTSHGTDREAATVLHRVSLKVSHSACSSPGAERFLCGRSKLIAMDRNTASAATRCKTVPSIENRRQTDRVTTPTRAGLRRFRWPRPR